MTSDRFETRCDECHGYGARGVPEEDWTVRQRLDVEAGGDPPETDCGACDGRGYIPTDEGQALLDFLARNHVLDVSARLALVESKVRDISYHPALI